MLDNFKLNIKKKTIKLRKHCPEILLTTGIISGIAGAVVACKQTPKIYEVLESAYEENDEIHKYLETNGYTEKYTKEDKVKDQAIIFTRTAIDIGKIYTPAIGLGVLSLTCILASHNILRQRNAALAAAYTIVDTGFKNYRNRVIERFGEEVDKELRFNINEKEVEEVVVDKNGKEKIVKKKAKICEGSGLNGLDGYSDYARFFDSSSRDWKKDPEYNLMYLKTQEQYANDLLRGKGYLYLNEVYNLLDIPETKAGQVVGWVYDPTGEKFPNHKGDNYIDFGVYSTNRQVNRDFVNGYENVILLDFNVDGNIWELM